MAFPVTRPRRLRMTEMIRNLVRETHLTPEQFVYPMFVCPGEGVEKEISSMPGNYQRSIDTLVEEARSVQSLGIGGIILFGIPATKDEVGSSGYDDHGIVQEAVRALKREVTGIVGHDGRLPLRVHQPRSLRGRRRATRSVNDPTVELLAKMALSHARAGRRHRRAIRHDGRPCRRHPGASGRERLHRTFRSCPMRSSMPPASMARSARRRNRRRPSGTGAATRWTRRTPARR